MALTIPTIFTAIDRLSRPMQNMTKNVDSFAFSAKNAGKQLLGFASTGVIFAGVALSTKAVMDFETQMQSLQAVTGVSDEKMKSFKSEIFDLAAKAKIMGVDVAKGFEVVGSAMSQYLDDPKGLRLITEAGITLSKAARMELEPTLLSLTSVMNQFGLSADMANDTINRLTAGEIVGSVRTAQIAEYLQEFGAGAKLANVQVSESVALIEALGIQLKADKIGIGARNLLTVLDSAKGLDKMAIKALRKNGVDASFLMDKSKSLGQRLRELSKIQNDAVAITQIFGKENKTAAQVIFNQLDTYEKFEKKIRGTNEAQRQADVNSNTLSIRLSQLHAKWINMITGSDQAGSSLNIVKNIIGFVTDNLESILKVGTGILIFFTAWKTIVLACKTSLFLYNIAIGIHSALTLANTVALEGNAVAMAASTIAEKIMTGWIWLSMAATKAWITAQWLLNAALMANPIGLIIISIIALIALITVIVNKWNEWGAALAIFLGPLGLIISLIQSFRRNWEMITTAFTEGGILSGLKAIGKTLLDAILMPLQQLLSLIAKFTGWDWAAGAAKSIDKFRADMGVNVTTNESGTPLSETPALNNKQVQNDAIMEKLIQTNNAKLELTLGNGLRPKNENAVPNFVRIQTTSTYQ